MKKLLACGALFTALISGCAAGPDSKTVRVSSADEGAVTGISHCTIDDKPAPSSVPLANGGQAYCYSMGSDKGEWRELIEIPGQDKSGFASKNQSSCIYNGYSYQIGDYVSILDRVSKCTFHDDYGFVWSVTISKDGNLLSENVVQK